MGYVIGTIVAIVIIGFFGFVGYLGYHSATHDSQSWECKTKGADMINTTEDNNLHVILFCVKDGVVVP